MATPEKLTFGSYEVLRNEDGTPCILGQGSFGVTYKARHVLLGRINALKVIREDLLNRGSQEDQAETTRFLGEARAVGRLQHPGIAVVHDCALDEGVFYYAMEYCDGGSLQDWCVNHGALPWSEVRPMALQIASALDYAHESGFLHRDLKPSNIMLTGEGAMRQAKLIDFGLAKKFVIEAEESTATVRDDQEKFRGNYATASPEQILEKPLDPRSDLFSLGVTLWWLLIGKNPFGGMKHGPMIADRVSASSYASSLPADLEPEARKLLEGLLEKDVERRIATALAVVEQLESTTTEVGMTEVGTSGVPAAVATSGPAELPAGTGAGVAAMPMPPELDDAYVVGSALVTANQAKLYAGEQMATRQPVVVLIPDASFDPAARAGMRLAASRRLDFGAYAFLDWRFSGGDDVFVISKPTGCSLMAVLRKFGPARIGDALPFLSHLARCFDACETWTTFGIQVEPGEIMVSTRDGGTDINRIHAWSDLDPLTTRCLPLFRSAGDHGSSSEATLSTSAHEFPPMAQFAALVYRVLSGSAVKYASFFTTSGYVMASGLSEDGNALLATTISDPASQPSACRFIRALAGLESLPISGLSPLIEPPAPQDLEAARLDPMPAAGSAAPPGGRSRSSASAQAKAANAERIAEIQRQLALAKQEAEKEAEQATLKENAKARRKQEEAQRQAAAQAAAQAATQAATQAAAQATTQAAAQAAAIRPPAPVAPVAGIHAAPGAASKRRTMLALVAVLVVVAVLGVTGVVIAYRVIKGHTQIHPAGGESAGQTAANGPAPKESNPPAEDPGFKTRPESNPRPDSDTPPANHTHPESTTVAGTEPSAGSPAIIQVPGDAKTLADAIKRCQPGGTIEIAGGTYGEAILLTKSISLVATSGAVFEDRGLGSDLVVASGTIQVTLRNIELKNTEEEIKTSPENSPALVLVKNGASVNFDHCVVEKSTGDGVSLVDKASATFADCQIRDNHGFGIKVSSASKVVDARGAIRDNGSSGIAVSNAGSSVTLNGTVIEGNAANGVDVDNGAQLNCRKVTIHGNKLEQKQKVGLLVQGGGSKARLEESCVISAHRVSGIGVIEAGRLEMDACSVEGNSKSGLYVRSGGQVDITACQFHSNGPIGVALMDSPSRIGIAKCAFSAHSDMGVAIAQGKGTITACTFTNNTTAVYFGEGANGAASGNSLFPGPLDKALTQENAGQVSFENNTLGTAP